MYSAGTRSAATQIAGMTSPVAASTADHHHAGEQRPAEDVDALVLEVGQEGGEHRGRGEVLAGAQREMVQAQRALRAVGATAGAVRRPRAPWRHSANRSRAEYYVPPSAGDRHDLVVAVAARAWPR